MSGLFNKRKAEPKAEAAKAPRVIDQYACEPIEEGKERILKKHNANYASLMVNCDYENLCFVGSDEKIEIFGIACKCGSHKLRILGHKLEGMDLLGDPISIACPECGEKHELFDSGKQGYDAELGVAGTCGGETEYVESNTVCKQCGNDTFELTLGFEYPDDIEDTAKEEKRDAKDLYTWMTGNAKCTHCGEITDIIDFECA